MLTLLQCRFFYRDPEEQEADAAARAAEGGDGTAVVGGAQQAEVAEPSWEVATGPNPTAGGTAGMAAAAKGMSSTTGAGGVDVDWSAAGGQTTDWAAAEPQESSGWDAGATGGGTAGW